MCVCVCVCVCMYKFPAAILTPKVLAAQAYLFQRPIVTATSHHQQTLLTSSVGMATRYSLDGPGIET